MMIGKSPEPELFRVEDVQVLLSVSKTTAWELVRSGQLQIVRIKPRPDAKRSLVRVTRKSLDEYIKSATVGVEYS